MLLFDPGDIQKHAAVRAASPFAHFAPDAARHVIAGQQFRRTPRVLVALRITPSFFFVVRGLVRVEFGGMSLNMKRSPFLLRSTPPSPRTPSVTRMPRTLGGHTMPVGWNCTNSMSISVGARVVSERVAVARVLPAVAGDFESASDSARSKHHCLRAKQLEAPALAVVPERARDAVAVFQQRDNRVFHVHVDAEMNSVVLQSADHLQPRPIADVRQARISVPAEIPLQYSAVFRAVEQRAPGFQFANAVGRLLRM